MSEVRFDNSALTFEFLFDRSLVFRRKWISVRTILYHSIRRLLLLVAAVIPLSLNNSEDNDGPDITSHWRLPNWRGRKRIINGLASRDDYMPSSSLPLRSPSKWIHKRTSIRPDRKWRCEIWTQATHSTCLWHRLQKCGIRYFFGLCSPRYSCTRSLAQSALPLCDSTNMANSFRCLS